MSDKNTISQIQADFENNNKLGVIVPEHFYAQIKYSFFLDNRNLKYLYKLFEA